MAQAAPAWQGRINLGTLSALEANWLLVPCSLAQATSKGL